MIWLPCECPGEDIRAQQTESAIVSCETIYLHFVTTRKDLVRKLSYACDSHTHANIEGTDEGAVRQIRSQPDCTTLIRSRVKTP